MKIAIIQFPGSNCETESTRAIRQAGMEPVEFLWNGDPQTLCEYDGYFIVGGFSYEDRSRAGIISALDPVMRYLKFESEKGKPILGICNGAQVLVESGMVPGYSDCVVSMALAQNKRVRDKKILGTGFYNAWVNLRMDIWPEESAFTLNMMPSQIMRVPVAHAEGRFIIPDELLQEMKDKNLVPFRYCDKNGRALPHFPINPNGAIDNLAAVINTRGNVMAMMPHPERSDQGQPIFTSMRDYIQNERTVKIRDLKCHPELECHPELVSGSIKKEIPKQVRNDNPKKSKILITELIITDNEAQTVETALRAKEAQVSVKRYTHWEITGDFDLEELKNSGEILNTNKERIAQLSFRPHSTPFGRSGQAGVEESLSEAKPLSFLVSDKDDFTGQHKLSILQERFGMNEIKEIKKGVLWQFTTIDEPKYLEELILSSHILANPYSQTINRCHSDRSLPKGDVAEESLSEATSVMLKGIPRLAPLARNDREEKSMLYTDSIKLNLNNCLTQTNLPAGTKLTGKVRDVYDLQDKMLLISTDRQSAFDRILASIPFKGQVLNQTSAWWFRRTAHIIPNHVIDVPDPNVTVAKKCKIFPVEFVVRGYITGSTDTSAWVNYEKGVRMFCGNELPEGMKKNQKFFTPIVTPTTKSENHDESISGKEIVARGLMTQDEWNYTKEKALELFRFGQAEAQKHGLILVDTKYEFGKDENGNILLCDEIHTPDSSRYWIADSYEERFLNGQEPENIDKEFLRLWFKDNCDPYNDAELPEAPEELVVELSSRYILLYEMITGEKFVPPEDSTNVSERIEKNLSEYLQSRAIITPAPIEKTSSAVKALIIAGSTSDDEHVQKIASALSEFNIAFETHVASAHKEAAKGLEIIEKYKNEKVIYITVAGRSNALSGFVAGNSDKPVIACPPFKDKMDMLVNIQSTLQMPSNVPVMTILEPKNVALAIKRIYG